MQLKSSTGKPVQVALLSSHTIVVPPEGCEVPKMFLQEAFKMGCVPIEVDIEEVKDDGALTGARKISVIVETIKKMLNDGCKLSGTGLPNLKEVSAATGFHVTKIEVAEAWNIIEAETKE